VVHGVLTSSTAPRLLRLMEACCRVPQLLVLDVRILDMMSFLPGALPDLHAAAGSPQGCRALLAAATTAAKRQHVANCILEQLVAADGGLVPAAAAIQDAVPGPIGFEVVLQLGQDTAMVV
jgi:hypothetical protein